MTRFRLALVAGAPSSSTSMCGTDEGTTALLVAAVEQSIWTTLLDPAEAGRFHRITDVQQRGDMVLAGVRIRLEDGDSAALVHLRMERDDGHWRVGGVEGLGPYMQAALSRRGARAAAAARARWDGRVAVEDRGSSGYLAATSRIVGPADG